MGGATSDPSKARLTTTVIVGVGGAIAGSLADAHTHWLVDAPPSSGSMVVLYHMCASVACLTVVSHRARDGGSSFLLARQ
jgi:hypothetical protein